MKLANPIMNLAQPASGRRGFTLIELLTVIFIISLLIAILIPSLTSARNAAKNTATSAIMNNALKVGLESFRTDNEKDFLQTNGYPPSYAHPRFGNPANPHMPHQGECPFLPNNPTLYGAQWLPLMLVGLDKNGLVQRSTVQGRGNLINTPLNWYGPNPLNSNPPMILPRAPLYIDPSNTRMSKLVDVTGIPNRQLFPDWNDGDTDPEVTNSSQEIPVLLDAFDQPILYYAANRFGTTANMVANIHSQDNSYQGGAQQTGQPYYFHQDNWGFTGRDTILNGWDFGGGGTHDIARSGHDLTSLNILSPENEKTFARFILESGGGGAAGMGGAGQGPLRPFNADSYLLISAGVDGKYGTRDDVTNFRKR
jgi:prepilin-type N-terminal cleavage/methylation domain-containing protein